jgi:hypothetical protein
MSRQTVLSFAKLMLLGAFSFWLPDVLWHAVIAWKDLPGIWDLILPTVAMPSALLGMYLWLKRQPVNQLVKAVGLPLMLGVWTLGGFFMAVGASFSHGGFAGGGGFLGGVGMTLLGFVPPYAFIMATYDASLGALVLATLAAIIIWLVPLKGLSRNLRRQQ